jgi:hypothetical protein
VALLVALLLICLVPALSAVFELQPLSLADLVLLGSVAAGWAVLVRAVWRWQLLERLLGTGGASIVAEGVARTAE